MELNQSSHRFPISFAFHHFFRSLHLLFDGFSDCHYAWVSKLNEMYVFYVLFTLIFFGECGTKKSRRAAVNLVDTPKNIAKNKGVSSTHIPLIPEVLFQL